MTVEEDARATEASDPTTHPAALSELSENPVLAPLVAANPNASFETLVVLAEAHPHEFLANPALPLLLLADPTLPGKLDASAVLSVLQCADVPAAFLRPEHYERNQVIRAVIAMHVQSVADAIDWRERLGHYLNETLRSYSSLAGKVRDYLQVRGLLPDWFVTLCAAFGDAAVREAVLVSPACPPVVQRWLWHADAEAVLTIVTTGWLTRHQVGQPPPLDVGWHRHLRLAWNETTPAFIFEQLATTAQPRRVRRELARNPALSAALVERLATDADVVIRRFVANRADLTPACCARLLDDGDVGVQCIATRNPALPAHLLQRSATSADVRLRRAAAHNARLPEAALQHLGADPDALVRRAVARHPSIPHALLERFTADPVPAIGLHATRRLAWARNMATTIRAVAATAQSARLLNEVDDALLIDIISQADTPPAVLATIYDDDGTHRRMQIALAANPATPSAILEELAREPGLAPILMQNEAASPEVRRATLRQVCKGEYVTPAFIDSVLKQSRLSPEERSTFWECYLAQRMKRGTSAMNEETTPVLASPLTSPATLRRWRRIFHWVDRLAIAMNPRTPPDVLEALAQDGNRHVRHIARERLAGRDPLAPLTT